MSIYICTPPPKTHNALTLSSLILRGEALPRLCRLLELRAKLGVPALDKVLARSGRYRVGVALPARNEVLHELLDGQAVRVLVRVLGIDSVLRGEREESGGEWAGKACWREGDSLGADRWLRWEAQSRW